MTNPSAGLPEELRQIVANRTQAVEVDGTTTTWVDSESVVRDVLDWACKRLCADCFAGIKFSDEEDLRHAYHNRGTAQQPDYWICAASVLREGK